MNKIMSFFTYRNVISALSLAVTVVFVLYLLAAFGIAQTRIGSSIHHTIKGQYHKVVKK